MGCKTLHPQWNSWWFSSILPIFYCVLCFHPIWHWENIHYDVWGKILYIQYHIFKIQNFSFKYDRKIDQIYEFLVKAGVLSAKYESDLDIREEALQIRMSFKRKENLFHCYSIRTIVEFLADIAFVCYMVFHGRLILESSIDVHCDVHGYWYECRGTPESLYVYSMYIILSLSIAHCTLNLYNLFCLWIPGLSKLNQLMKKMKEKG